MTKQITPIPPGYRYHDIMQELEFQGYLGTPSETGTLIPEKIFEDYFDVTPRSNRQSPEKAYGFFVHGIRLKLEGRGFSLDGGNNHRIQGLSAADRKGNFVLMPIPRLAGIINEKIEDGINSFKRASILGIASLPMVQEVCTKRQTTRHVKALNRAETLLEVVKRNDPLKVGQKKRGRPRKLTAPPVTSEVVITSERPEVAPDQTPTPS